VRAADRLTDTATRHKVRLRDLARQAMPMVGDAISGELTLADVAVLERYGDPRAMVRAGRARLTALIRKASRGHSGEERAEAWLDVARSALDLYGDDPARSRSRIWLPRWPAKPGCCGRCSTSVTATRLSARPHTAKSTRPVWPEAFPAFADIGGPVLVAAMGDPKRFADAAAFKRFTGLMV